MNIGKLDRLITLQAPAVVAQDSFGQPAPASFTDAVQVYAQVTYPQGREAVEAAERTAVQPVAFTIRYRPGVLPTWRVRYNDQTYQLTAVAEIGRRVGLTLTGYAYHDGEEPGV